MCNNETHFELNPTQHVTRCAFEVETTRNMIRFGREGASVDAAEASAKDGLEIVDANPDVIIDAVCVDMLRSVVSGSLRTA